MKVIDLLNKIANDKEVPKKFIYNEHEFYLNEGVYKYTYKCDELNVLFEEYVILENLNEEIEIIEEKEIEKLDRFTTEHIQDHYVCGALNTLNDKISVLIDELNKIKKEIKK